MVLRELPATAALVERMIVLVVSSRFLTTHPKL
jgi:hypothetical protein